jgi:hypothetical protein
VLAGLQVLVGVEVIDHLVERIDVPRLQIRAVVWVAKGRGVEGQALQVNRDLCVTDDAEDA